MYTTLGVSALVSALMLGGPAVAGEPQPAPGGIPAATASPGVGDPANAEVTTPATAPPTDDPAPEPTETPAPQPPEAEVPVEQEPADPEGTETATPDGTSKSDAVGPVAERSQSLLRESAALAAVPSFTAGYLISDFNFFNSWAMTEAEIQAFLQAKVGSCANSYCLAALRVDTPNFAWSFGTCDPYPGAPGEPAARIIYKVQRLCGLSAKVILTTLQKEQTLITDPDPTGGQLRSAMGMACPDTAPCDTAYSGFFSQVYGAARQLTWYTNPQSSMYQSGRYAVGQVRSIAYDPDPGCGSSGVYINNIATAALYHYTPYQPNANALAAGWDASSDPCASYGNRNFWNFYNLWFGNPTTAPNPAATRLAGNDRFETAVMIARSSFPSTAPVVYVTAGGNYPDALAAGGAAAVDGGPLLLVDPGYVPSSTLAELKRLAPSSIVLVGGQAAVSVSVETTLKTVAPVTRLGGADRYDTAMKVADFAFGTATTAYLATGMDFPDALSASAAGGAKKAPVLLANGSLGAIDAATIAELRKLGVTTVKIVGGTSAVSPGVEQGIRDAGFTVQRLFGADRYMTSVAINRDAFPNPSKVYVATGTGFADALSGSAAAAKAGSPLYVTFPGCVNNDLRSDALKATSLVMLGGSAVLGDQVAYLAVC
ncbi:putative cell wall-binding protein [Agromyces sp. 3263]|uniref:cell wall-binding repeat-containing protein n=1 Tax=Agromyces sp. 3263 TaxID=2817750 RepID=UPI0028608A02|nr:cell wall-binding repeat-containing protein [Agromyces sp. 3263]MDR6904654.1 putative cell wall-binding protein [Agromyces sp. 3263]